MTSQRNRKRTILHERAESDPDGLALTDLEQCFTWLELADAVDRGAAALRSLQLPPGAHLAIVAHNSALTALAYLAARHAGISLIPVSYHLTAEELSYIFTDGAVAAVICDTHSEEAVVEAADECNVPYLYSIGEGHVGPSMLAWMQRFEPVAPDLSVPAVCDVLYTSGTTGFPKGVAHPRQLVDTVADYLELHREDPEGGAYLTVGPLYHAGPLGSIRRIAGGRPLVVMRRFDAAQVLAAIDEFEVTGSTMVPTHFARLLALPDKVRDAHDVSSMVMLDHTGSSCPPAVKRAMIDWFGPVLYERYGGTESGTICSISSTEWLDHPGSVGRPSDRFEILVLDDDENELEPGRVGQIYFHDLTGRGVSFRNAPEKTASAHLRPGVFTLGDLGHVDEDGYLFITGRASELVVSGGVNLYPAEVERVLSEHPGIVDVAVIGIPHPEMGEQLKALIVAADPDLDADAVHAFCRTRLAGPKCPRSIDFVDSLQRTPMGKLDRRRLSAPFWGEARPDIGDRLGSVAPVLDLQHRN